MSNSVLRLGTLLARAVPLLFLAACQAAQQEPQSPVEVPQYSIEEFLDSTSYVGGSFSPDNSKVLVRSNETGIFNAYALPVGGGEPVPLTDSTTDSIFPSTYFPTDEAYFIGSVAPDGRHIALEKFQTTLDSDVHLLERTSGHVSHLTPHDGNVSNTTGPFSPDGSSLEARSRRHGRHRVVFYGCSAYHRKGKSVCANGLTLPGDILEEANLGAVEDVMLDPRVVEAALDRAVARLGHDTDDATLGALEHEIAQV